MRFSCFSRSSINCVTTDNLIFSSRTKFISALCYPRVTSENFICSSQVNFTSILRKSHVTFPINIIKLHHSCRTFENFITIQNVKNVTRKEHNKVLVNTLAVQNASQQKPFQTKSEPRNWINKPKADFFNVNKCDSNIPSRDLKKLPSEINFIPKDISLERHINFQKLVDAVDEYGRKWDFISKEIFNYNFSPELLQYRYENAIKCFGPNFWTTKETKKLIDAVLSFGEEWKLISSDVFKSRRRASQCRCKWEKLTYGKILENSYSSEYKCPPQYQNSQSFPPRNHDPPFCSLFFKNRKPFHIKDNPLLEYLPEDRNRKRNKYDYLFDDLYKGWTDHDTHTLIKVVNQHGENWELITKKYFIGNSVLGLKLKWAKFVSSERISKNEKDDLTNNTKDKNRSVH
ncbi:4053_t:CDS:2 [Diversispora eburnea]|uniref:4053_t:CDS:1 n=1 Tax=Diversispora eburnea TaxID=1213867 RepID=A0A9N9F6T4_9GLOM|nr:4053_t:CDS:2 [Diversispora eburnea]